MQKSIAILREEVLARGGLSLRTAGLTLLAGTALAATQTVTAASGFVSTTDEHGSTLSRIDLGNGETQTTEIPISPHNVQVTPDHQWVLAVGEPGGHNDHGHSHGPGQLLVFNAGTFMSGPQSSIDVGEKPIQVHASTDGEHVYVANEGTREAPGDSVSVIEEGSYMVAATHSVGHGPNSITWSKP